MAGRIIEMTAEQAALLPLWRDEWFRIGTCTDPANRPRAEVAIGAMYREIGRKPPHFIWVDSPLSASIIFHVLGKQDSFRASLGGSLRTSLWDSLRDSLRTSLWDSIGASLWDSLGDSLGDSLRDSLWASLRTSLWASIGASLGGSLGGSLRTSLWDSLWGSLRTSLWGSLRTSLWDSLGTSLWDSLGDSLWASLRDSLRDSLWASLRDSLRDSLWGRKIEPKDTGWLGQQDSYWVAFYAFCREIGVTYQEDDDRRLRLHEDLCHSAMWWWPRDGLCMVCERPALVGMDERGLLHAEDGPAVLFRDGWSIYAVHGVRVPAAVIMDPASITVEVIDAESNQEIRRVMMGRYRRGEEVSGAAAYVRDSGAELVDADPEYGRLWRKCRDNDTDLLMVEVVNGTPEPDGTRKAYWLRVHPECRPLRQDGSLGNPQPLTARSAVASTYGLRAEEYRVGART